MPPSQGWELHHALKQRGVETEMVLYPREPHGIGERAHRIDSSIPAWEARFREFEEIF